MIEVLAGVECFVARPLQVDGEVELFGPSLPLGGAAVSGQSVVANERVVGVSARQDARATRTA